jgi:hypothetical protein
VTYCNRSFNGRMRDELLNESLARAEKPASSVPQRNAKMGLFCKNDGIRSIFVQRGD